MFFTLSLNLFDKLSYLSITNDVLLATLSRGVILGLVLGIILKKEENDALIVVVGKREVSSLRKLVKSINPNAFVVISDIHKTIGEGFKQIY